MNTAELLLAIRRTGQLQAADPNFPDAFLLEEAQQALIDRFAEPITTLRQGYWLQTSTTTTANANTTGLYRMPPRAVVAGLEKLEVSLDGTNWYQCNILTHFQATGYEQLPQGQPYAYTLNGDCVRLFPTPLGDYTIKFTYYLRPPTMITYASSCRITASFFNVLTVDTNPSGVGVTTSTGLDVQDADGSHELAVVGASIDSITGAGPYTITLAGGTTGVPTGRVSVGDYVRQPDTCVFPMLPRELHRALADYTAATVLLSKGDMEKGSALAAKAKTSVERVVSMAQPRIKTAPFTFRRNSYLRSLRGYR